MFNQSRDSVGSKDRRIVGIEAEAVLVVLYARVKRAPVLAERHREQVLLLGRVAEEKRAWGMEENIDCSVKLCRKHEYRE